MQFFDNFGSLISSPSLSFSPFLIPSSPLKGSLVIGEIRVNRFHWNEAFVKPRNSRIYTDIATEPIAKQDVLIHGMVDRYDKQYGIYFMYFVD